MDRFGTEASRYSGTATVRVHGELDLYTAPQLQKALDDAIAGTPHELVVDLTDVSFVDSTGLSLLVRAYKRLRPIDATVVVRGAAGQVYKTLAVTKLTSVLNVEPPVRASA